MRRVIVLSGLVVLLTFPAFSWADASSVRLRGVILSVDETGGVVTVKTGMSQGGGRLVRVVLPERMVYHSGADFSVVDSCLTVGRNIELWGIGGNMTDEFIAEKIKGCAMAGCDDPTGVRARLFINKRSGGRMASCRE